MLRSLRIHHLRALLLCGTLLLTAAGASIAVAATGHGTRHHAKANAVPLATTRVTKGLPIVGLADGAAGFGGASTGPRLDLLERTTRTKWLRDTFSWAQIEPRPGVFRFGYYDHYMLAVAQRHLHVLAQVVNAPPWSASNQYAVPRNPTQYARTVAAILHRYGVGGTFWKAHPTLAGSAITEVELWNEPYYDNGDAGDYDPGRYARLVRATSLAVRPVDPHAGLLLEAEMVPHHYRVWRWWVDSLYLAVPDLNRYFTGVSAHAYGSNATGLSPIKPDEPYPNDLKLRRIEDLRRQFVSHGAASKPFWLSEVGFSTCHGDPRVCMSYAKQRTNLEVVDRYLHGRWSRWVQGALVYRYEDSAPATSVQGGYGLTTIAGKPKPALAVFRRMAEASGS